MSAYETARKKIDYHVGDIGNPTVQFGKLTMHGEGDDTYQQYGFIIKLAESTVVGLFESNVYCDIFAVGKVNDKDDDTEYLESSTLDDEAMFNKYFEKTKEYDHYGRIIS
ncbi:MAG: hypothetical protein MJZ25_15655 [Fibrobacter sp.]|nr:hypothetical protein [Fibrobacter sp.]